MTSHELRLYDYAASGNCYKVRLLLAQLGPPYERVPIDIFGGDTLTHDYARINPHPTTPVRELVPGRYLVELPRATKPRSWASSDAAGSRAAGAGYRFRGLPGGSRCRRGHGS